MSRGKSSSPSPTSIRRSTTRLIASRVGASVRRTCSRSWRSCEMRPRIWFDGQRSMSVLELVDLVVERVDEVEEVLGDQVDDAGTTIRPTGGSCSRWIDACAAEMSKGARARGSSARSRASRASRRRRPPGRRRGPPRGCRPARGRPRRRSGRGPPAAGGARRHGAPVRSSCSSARVVDLAPERRSKLGLRGVEQVDPLGHAPRLAAASVGASPRGAPRARWPGGPREPRASARSRARPSRRCRQR